MAKSDTPSLNIITPKGVAVYPKLNKPDTKFDADGVYEVKLRLDPDATGGTLDKKSATLADIIAAATKLRDEFLAEKKAELAASSNPKAKKKAKEIEVREIGEADLDEDGEETGLILLKAKMKASGISKKDQTPWTRAPKLFDAKGKPLDAKTTQIWGGSVLKVAAKAVPYYAANDNIVGVTLYLEAVQVIELVSGGGRDAGAFGFGEEEGYEGDSGSAAPFDDSDAGDTDAPENEDF